MEIRAVSSSRDVLLTLTSSSEPINKVGYRIERKREGADWQVWDGASFSSGEAALITGTRFADYDVADGIYQYRFALMADVLSAYAYSDWVRIGSGYVGWTFDNYTPPEGRFGDVLTVDDLRKTYLWGIEFKASNGELFTDAQVRSTIRSASDEIARALKITIEKKRILCQPDASLVLGVDYDEAEDPYTYRHDKWNRSGRIVLRRRPIISVSRFEFYGIADQKILNLLSWTRIDHRKGVISFYPRAGSDNSFRIIPAAMTLGASWMSGDYPHGYKVDYVAGYENSSRIPDDLREVIGKVAACKLLNIIGDGLIAGFSSSSLSIDGLSESFSSTQSATNAFFGARIQVYLKDIESYLKENRNKFGVQVMGSI
ncbi:MAG: hypothetical protein SAMD01599839_07890 [Rectinema sp.]